MLLQDEQYIIKWLSQYGTLTKTQVIRLLKDKPVSTAEKIIRNLKRDMRITDVGGYYLALDEMCKPDQRLIHCGLGIITVHRPGRAACPLSGGLAQIFFLKENVGYEIVVLYGEQHLMRLLQPQEDDLKYIIVVPHISMAQSLYVPKVPCLYATVDFEGREEPHITFYSEEAINSESK